MKNETEEKTEVLTPLPAVDMKVVQYFKARKTGKSKTDASLLAGYADAKHASRIEKTQAYQNLSQAYRNALLETMPLNEIAQLNARNARQERDLGASNMALKLALDRTLAQDLGSESDDMIVLLKGDTNAYRIK